MFDNIIGQDEAKSQLKYFIRTQEGGAPSPNILLGAPRGGGKTSLMREYAKQLRGPDGRIKPYVEVNCSSFKNKREFFDFIVGKRICERPVTVGFDEAHKLPEDVQTMFLTLLNVEKSAIRVYDYKESQYEFNFNEITFVFATTDTQKIQRALQERMNLIDLHPYSLNELEEIMRLHASQINFSGSALTEAASTVRRNARLAVQRAKQINEYCKCEVSFNFGDEEWEELRKQLCIYPLGINKRELSVLKLLKEYQVEGCTVTMIAATTGNTRSALQNDIEHYLLATGLIKIAEQSRRFITKKGLEILEKIK